MLSGAENLGLAIGIEFGSTPVCRLGLRGKASVRAAASKATCVSEAEQRRCEGHQTALGERALRESSATVREAFSADRILDNLDVETAEVLFGTMPSPYLNTGAESDHMRAHEPEVATPMRAHDRR